MFPILIRSNVLTATLLPYGASLVGLRFGASDRNLVLGFANLSRHMDVPIYAGAIVGPVANRIGNGLITIDGVPYQMRRNEAGRTALHSGPEGLHGRTWNLASTSDCSATFSITLSDGACGLPGTRTITAAYAVHENSLNLTITAITDAATPLNIAAHPYWNLDGRPDISGHRLHINADRYTPTNDQNLPTGAVAPTLNTKFDFTQAAPVPLDPALDVNYCLADAARTSPTHAATLTGADGTALHVSTTAPGLQVYNGAFLPNLPSARSQNRHLIPYGGIALEPQHWPDAPNQPDFPQITLRPGQTYSQITTYQLFHP